MLPLASLRMGTVEGNQVFADLPNGHHRHVLFAIPLLQRSRVTKVYFLRYNIVIRITLLVSADSVVTPLKKGQPREEDRYMRGCGLRPHPLIYPSPLLEGSFFSALCNRMCL